MTGLLEDSSFIIPVVLATAVLIIVILEKMGVVKLPTRVIDDEYKPHYSVKSFFTSNNCSGRILGAMVINESGAIRLRIGTNGAPEFHVIEDFRTILPKNARDFCAIITGGGQSREMVFVDSNAIDNTIVQNALLRANTAEQKNKLLGLVIKSKDSDLETIGGGSFPTLEKIARLRKVAIGSTWEYNQNSNWRTGVRNPYSRATYSSVPMEGGGEMNDGSV